MRSVKQACLLRGFKENFNFLLTIPFLSPGIPRRKIEPFERQKNVSVLI